MVPMKDILKYIELEEKDRKNGTRNRFKAPKGKFRVIGVDTFAGPTADYLIGDYDTLPEAKEKAALKGGPMNVVYIYGEDGDTVLFQAGIF